MHGIGVERTPAARALGPAGQAALRLHPHRTLLLAWGLGSFVAGALPLAAVAHGLHPLARWHVAAFAASVPVVLWAFGLVALATFFHPTEGLVGVRNGEWRAQRPWVQGLMRAYAALTVGAFGVSPAVVLGAAVV